MSPLAALSVGGDGLTIVGGGIVGLATAWQLLQRHPGLSLTLLEKDAVLAGQQTGHNSGVIHSGLYYRPGSFKARLCCHGREALYAYCERKGIPFRRCGKLVVALSPREEELLQALRQRGEANGLTGLRWLVGRQLRRYEPHAAGRAALLVPQTGVVDFRTVAQALAGDIRDRGGKIVTGCRLEAIRRRTDGFSLRTSRGDAACRWLINCAGLHSDRIARMAGLRPPVRIFPFRGEYYHLGEEGAKLVRNLIYPVPDPELPFLGVHLTRGIDGRVEAGPNAVLALKREGYRRRDISLADLAEIVGYPGFWRLATGWWRTGLAEYRRSLSRRRFLADLQRLVPALRGEDLADWGSGVRAQAVDRAGRLVDDFVFADAPGMIHVLNAPSPAATASLAIGEEIAARAAGNFAL
ncbi:L-2-hydroxyglutarate oxidase [Geothermobacter ehrlichii]|uniref:L-2-hydroxyglutarate oxidase n=1 Tax=Geothermobacter ehrlichii TaxID=213224 RepID=A0A5D3WHN1_9BACT|nr:L-2-hydroxyglutarate oxidase [Geothermobacter ehrlichii]TYO96362.1 L-2-hydroxyglutarate oxidase [Geothermobacter ehrlichii]